VKLHAFMTTPELAGAEFSGKSWSTWRVIARLIDGDAAGLTSEEQALALALTGRTALPSAPPREVYIGAGRRSGKSRFGALVSAWLAAQEYPQLAAGETAVVAHVAPDRRQAGIDLAYARGIAEGSAILRAELVSATQDSLTFRHRTQLEVATASYRTVRGRSLCGAVIDESAFLRADDSALPDVELARALRPALLTLGGLLLAISSPHRKVGLLYEAHRKYFASDSATRGLYIQATSRQLNPTLDEEAIEEAMRDDPAAAQSEFLGLFRADLQSFLDDGTVNGAIVPNRRALPKTPGCRYVAFCDPSGGRADSFTLAIAHQERRSKDRAERAVLDLLAVVVPPFDPERTVESMCETLSDYGLRQVSGDAYAGEWVTAMFRKFGVTYRPAELSKSEVYLEALPLFAQGKVELLDVPLLRTQLLLLERRSRAGSRADVVDHPRGAHDDAANAACGAIHLAACKRSMKISEADLASLGEISPGSPAASGLRGWGF
jgi:hypothetical protein